MPELSERAVELLRQREPILAIKSHRDEHGLSLRVARAQVMAHPEYARGRDAPGYTYHDKFHSLDDVLALLDKQVSHERAEVNADGSYGDGWSRGRAGGMEQVAKILRALKARGPGWRDQVTDPSPEHERVLGWFRQDGKAAYITIGYRFGNTFHDDLDGMHAVHIQRAPHWMSLPAHPVESVRRSASIEIDPSSTDWGDRSTE